VTERTALYRLFAADDTLPYAHIRRQIKRHGDEGDNADLAAAEEELRERRSRKGGRPPRSTG
jgi:hypothetical protein